MKPSQLELQRFRSKKRVLLILQTVSDIRLQSINYVECDILGQLATSVIGACHISLQHRATESSSSNSKFIPFEISRQRERDIESVSELYGYFYK